MIEDTVKRKKSMWTRLLFLINFLLFFFPSQTGLTLIQNCFTNKFQRFLKRLQSNWMFCIDNLAILRCELQHWIWSWSSKLQVYWETYCKASKLEQVENMIQVIVKYFNERTTTFFMDNHEKLATCLINFIFNVATCNAILQDCLCKNIRFDCKKKLSTHFLSGLKH